MIFHGKLMRADLGEGSESIGKLLNIENQGKKRGKGRFINAGDSGKDRKAQETRQKHRNLKAIASEQYCKMNGKQ